MIASWPARAEPPTAAVNMALAVLGSDGTTDRG